MKISIYIGIVCVLFVGFVRYLEGTSLFYPDRNLRTTPRDINLQFKDVYFKSANKYNLHGWFVGGEGKKTILFLHGNAGNISDRLAKIEMFHRLGLNVFIIDYRGYGKSEGHPTEKGMYLDTQGAYDYLIAEKKIEPSNIIVYGASLGGAAAVDLASNNVIDALIVDSTFSSAKDMAKRIYPFIPSFLLGVKLDSIKKIDRVTVPKLFIHSRDDEMIPIELGKKLFEAANEPKNFVTISGGHNDGHIYDQEKFINAISKLINNEKY